MQSLLQQYCEGIKFATPKCVSLACRLSQAKNNQSPEDKRKPVCAKSIQLCLTLCDPMDCSPPGSSVHGILRARILEWVALPSFRGSSQPRIELASLMSNLCWQAGSLQLVPLGSYDKPRQHIKSQRHYFANKGPSSQGCGFSSGRVWM